MWLFYAERLFKFLPHTANNHDSTLQTAPRRDGWMDGIIDNYIIFALQRELQSQFLKAFLTIPVILNPWQIFHQILVEIQMKNISYECIYFPLLRWFSQT